MIYVIKDGKELEIPETELGKYQRLGYEQSYSLISPDGVPTIVPFSQLKNAKADGFKLNPEFAHEADVSKLESLGRGFLKEMSLGFADEVGGGVGGVLTGKGYSKGKEDWQSKDALADLANPKSYTTGQAVGVGGSLAIPLGGTGKGLSKVMQAGALQGAVQGFGEGEGLEESLKGAAMGGALGAGVGAGVHGLSKAASGAINLASKAAPSVKGAVTTGLEKAAKLGGLSDEAATSYKNFLSNPHLLKEAEEAAAKFERKLPELTKKAQSFSDDIADSAGNFFEKNFKNSLKETFTKEDVVAAKQLVSDALMAVKAAPKDHSKAVKDLLAATTARAPKANAEFAWELRRNIDDIFYRDSMKRDMNRYDTELLTKLRESIQEIIHKDPQREMADKLYSNFSEAWTNGLKKELVGKSGKVDGAKVDQLLNPKRQTVGKEFDMQKKWDDVEEYLEQNLDLLPKELKEKFQEFKSERNPLKLLKELNKLKGESGSSTGRSLGTIVAGQALGPVGAAVSAAIYNPAQILQAQQLALKTGAAAKRTATIVEKLMARGFSKQSAEQLAARLGASILEE